MLASCSSLRALSEKVRHLRAQLLPFVIDPATHGL